MTGYDLDERERKRAEDSNRSAWILFWCLLGAGVVLVLSRVLS